MYTVVFIRHGQSVWNLENRFTAWTDVGLTDVGVAEAAEGARLLREGGHDFDVCFTSVLRRAIQTLHVVQESLELLWLPVYKSWRLNERHYGALQGLNKRETAEKYGDEQVFAWRRSYATPPPPLTSDDPRHPTHDRRYGDVARETLPSSESLADTVARAMPYWRDVIAPTIKSGKRVLVAAHGNSLRAVVKSLSRLSDEEITGLNIPTGLPLVYELDENLEPLRDYSYLGSPEEAARRARVVAEQAGGVNP